MRKDMKLIQDQKNRGMRITKQVGSLLNLGVHRNIHNKTKRRPHLGMGEPDLRKKYQLLHQERKSLE
jgi:hypothetical protein